MSFEVSLRNKAPTTNALQSVRLRRRSRPALLFVGLCTYAFVVSIAALALAQPASAPSPRPLGRIATRGSDTVAAAGAKPAGSGSASSQPSQVDPFAHLTVVIPRDQLGPLRSVRVRDRKEDDDRKHARKVVVWIRTRPKGARVIWGRETLGKTPYRILSTPGATPADLVIRKAGYMTLHTRVQRNTNRNYFFQLHPAKLR